MAVNSGLSDSAQAYCHEAQALADMANDTTAKMWALGTRSLALYYRGDYADSDAAAAEGIALAPEDPQAIRLLVNGRARARGRLGDRRGTNEAIDQALDLSDRQPRLPEGFTSCISFETYSPSRTLANAVTAHLSAGETKKVLRYAEELEVQVEHSDSQWTRALVRLDVATALLVQKQPDLEQAVALGREALRAGGSTPIQSVWTRANELLHQAQRWHREPVVRDYAEELRTLNFTPEASTIDNSGGQQP